jgi:hypothetical protein
MKLTRAGKEVVEREYKLTCIQCYSEYIGEYIETLIPEYCQVCGITSKMDSELILTSQEILDLEEK